MKTVEEARQCWCPFARCMSVEEDWTAKPGQAARNRLVTADGESSFAQGGCIASECMAWRWGTKRNPDWKPTGSMMPWPAPHPDDSPAYYITDKTRGHCGLAGKP